ncbi:MAG: threonine-phosphate decarboxylase CobD, partial [Pseudomonadota bacterium]
RADFARFDLQETPVLDFSVNLNPLGPPAIIKDRWMEWVDELQNYPTIEGEGAARYYREKFGLPPENCLAGNGSTEIIYLLPRALGIDRILIAAPSYNDYTRASTLAGAVVHRHSLLQDSPAVSFDNHEVIEKLGKADALWVGSPNNPTGTLFPKEHLLECAAAYPDKWIIIDEAFMPFVEGRAHCSFACPPFRKNIIVIQSITKFYALAGLRLGGIIGHELVIARLRAAKEPWTVNGIAEKVAPLLLQCGDYEEETRVLVKGERDRLFQALKSMPGIVPFPSAANFILCRWQLTDNLDDLQKFLLSKGFYIRDCRNFPGLEENYFRLAVRLPGENDQLISALNAFPGNAAQ